MDEERANSATGLPSGALALVTDLVTAVPRMAERTRDQAEFTRRLLAHAPCIGAWFRPQEQVSVPEHEATQPVDVLAVVALGDVGAPTETPGHAPLDAPVATSDTLTGGREVPGAGELAIPEYDSLAASQVVPRLAMLGAEELTAIGDYERANRRRQTILNRVTQLLAG